jgi:hypothetical protein
MDIASLQTKTDSSNSDHQYKYAFTDTPDEETLSILGTIPNRWGRMPPLSRAMVVETGRFLQAHMLPLRPYSIKNIGLIGGTTRGSLSADLYFATTLLDGLASPAIFGYTLANTPLAEAANHYGLTGPVYAVVDQNAPLTAAVDQARLLVKMRPSLGLILACAFDDRIEQTSERRISITFSLINNNG